MPLMTPSCASISDSVNPGSSCSGICSYNSAHSIFPCTCSSPDTSQELPAYVHKLATALQRVVQHNDAEVQVDTEEACCFRGRQKPAIGIKAYIMRIAKYSKCSPVCFIMAWAYLKRLTQIREELVVTSWTVHRLLVTAVMLAAKMMDDKYYNNAYYAQIGGVSQHEINTMELQMLQLLEYRTMVTPCQVKGLLARLDAFQRPGRLTSVLCKKRSSQMVDSPLPQPASDGHRFKVPKGQIAAQTSLQPPLPAADQLFVDQNTHDVSCTKAGFEKSVSSSKPVSIKASGFTRFSSQDCPVPVGASINALQASPIQHPVNCQLLFNCPHTVQVTA